MLASVLIAVLPILASAKPIEKRYSGVHIVSGRDGKCLAAAPKTGVGSAVLSVDCSSSNYPMNWDINPGSGSVILSGTSNPVLALDAGSNPGNNGALKVWQSYPGLYQQTWYLTGDNRIAITGGNQCLDEGDQGNLIQTYQCTTGNTNQVFYIQPGSGGTPPPSSSASSTTSSSTSSVGPTSSSTPPPSGGFTNKQIRHQNRCVTIQNGFAGKGTVVADSDCFGTTDQDNSPDPTNSFGALQLWNLPAVGTQGKITSKANTALCLDAGSNPSNGAPDGVKIWDCIDGLIQQQWTVGADGTIKLANNQCLDERAESGPQNRKPYGSLKDLQTWQCYPGNGNQQFTVA